MSVKDYALELGVDSSEVLNKLKDINMITEEMNITSLCSNISINEECGHLYFAGCDTAAMAEKYGTPLYLLDESYIRKMCKTYVSAMKEAFDEFSMPLYASKALSFKKIYNIIDSEGMGADVASVGELFTALQAGFPSHKLMFHGNNKTENSTKHNCKVRHDNGDPEPVNKVHIPFIFYKVQHKRGFDFCKESGFFFCRSRGRTGH